MTPEEFNEVWQQFLHGTENERKNAFNRISIELWDNLKTQAKGIFNRYLRSDTYRYIDPDDIVQNALLVFIDIETARLEMITSLDGLRGYLYRILENIFRNEYRRLDKDGAPLPNLKNVKGEDLGQNYYKSLPEKTGKIFRGDDLVVKLGALFNGRFKEEHELCYNLLIAHYVEGIKYRALIEENRFPQYHNAAALEQIAHRNRQDFKKLW